MTKLSVKIKVALRKRNPLFFINLILLFAVLSFFNLACSKYPSKIGADLMPYNSLSMHLKQDTFQVYSELTDTTRSDKLPQNLLGSIHDSVFGTTNAGFYTTLLPTTSSQRFGPNPKTDSLILQLNILGVYGDTNCLLRVHVYELKDRMYFDSTYYSNKKLAVYPTDYADEYFRPDPNSFYAYSYTGANDTLFDTVKNVIRLNLSHISTALGDKLLNADTTVMDSTELFLDFFRGLYLKVDPVQNGGAIASFTTNTTRSVLIVYYHNDTADSLQYRYRLSGFLPKLNHYEHNYTLADAKFRKQVINGDTTLGQQQFYVQGLAGVKTIIKFPHVRDLNKLGKIGVNEAKLILPGAINDPYPSPPAELALVKIDSAGLSQLPDEAIEGPDYFGGYYDKDNNSYSFRITHYIQSLLQDSTKVDYGLLLYVKGSTIDPSWFVFNGPEYKNDSLRRARLNILYTIVK